MRAHSQHSAPRIKIIKYKLMKRPLNLILRYVNLVNKYMNYKRVFPMIFKKHLLPLLSNLKYQRAWSVSNSTKK